VPYDSERAFAIEAVLKASRLCREVQGALVAGSTLSKDDRSPVTVADFGGQALVSAGLARAFPGDGLVAEEDTGQLRDPANAATLDKVVRHVQAVDPGMTPHRVLEAIERGTHPGGSSGRFWTLDPIDGTKGFLRGEQYAVALALIEDGRVVVGVLGCPSLPLKWSEPQGPTGSLLAAVRGTGVTLRSLHTTDETPVTANAVDNPADAVFCESVESGHSAHDDSAKVAQALGVRAKPLRIDSQCKYAAVARGDAAIYLRLPTRVGYEEMIWDHAAGSLVVEEAGGRVTDMRGQALDFSAGRTLKRNRGVVASNGRLHDAILAAIANVL